MLRQGWSQKPNVTNTSHRYCVNFIGCRSDDELNSRLPAWYTNYQVLSSKVPTYLADDIHLASESSDRSLRFSSGRKCYVTRVYRCFDAAGPRTGTTYLPVCETRKSAAQNSEDNWKYSCLRRTLLLTYLINGVPKYSRSMCRIKEIVFHVHSLEGTTTSLITNADHWTWL